MKAIPTCPDCQGRAKLTRGKVIYPHIPVLASKAFWACLECRCWVGCHPGTERPLGSLAGPELRQLRHRVHELLDPLWSSGAMKREQAYAHLASRMGLTASECHVGKFDQDQCLQAIQILQSRT